MTPRNEVARWLSLPQVHGRPEGVVDARPKVKYATSVKTRRNGRLHLPTATFCYFDEAGLHVAARYACKEVAADVALFDFHPGLTFCDRCAEVASGEGPWKVYAYSDSNGRCLYVGQTCNLTLRKRTHAKTAAWHARHTSLEVLSTHPGRLEALAAEAVAIRSLRPVYNVIHNGEVAA